MREVKIVYRQKGGTQEVASKKGWFHRWTDNGEYAVIELESGKCEKWHIGSVIFLNPGSIVALDHSYG